MPETRLAWKGTEAKAIWPALADESDERISRNLGKLYGGQEDMNRVLLPKQMLQTEAQPIMQLQPFSVG